MDFRYQVKQILRMCGHAFVSTVHDRMNAMDQQINNVLDQNSSLARTQTALLQSCVHVVETLQRVQAEVCQQAQQTRELIEELRAQQVATLQSGAEQSRHLLEQLLTHQAATLQSGAEQSRHLLEQFLTQQAAALQSGAEQTRHLLEQLLTQQAATVQSEAEQTRRRIEQLASEQAATLQSEAGQTRQLVEQFLTQQAQASTTQKALLESCAAGIQAIQGDRELVCQTSSVIRGELRQQLANLMVEESGDHQTQLQLCRLSVERLAQLTDGQTAVREQVTALAQLAGGQTAVREQVTALAQFAADQTAMREQVSAFVRDVRSFLEHEVPSQVCIETSDYAFTNPEIGLMSFLYSHLPGHKALDVGAHVGDVSEHLLRTGYEVFAFEPFPASYGALVERLKRYSGFHPHDFALGRIDAELPLHLAADLSGNRKYDNATAFNSLIPHSMPDDLPFSGAVLVPVRSLTSLHRDNVVPADISLVKIDTEGYDLEVVRGMGDHRYPVVAVEYWDTGIPFGKSGLLYTLGSMSEEMHRRGYAWSIVLYRIWGRNQTAFYCNHSRSVPQSWGNIFFFRDYEIFAHAQRWCAAVLPRTYFKPVAAQ